VTTTASMLAFISMPGPMEMMFLAAVALLIFGKDLPNVLREWGKTFNEVRRHLNTVKSELNDAIYAEPERPKLQYHPQFHNRDPLPEQIPAEESKDLNGSDAGAAPVVNGDVIATVDNPSVTPMPSD
jgi:Sec-independent protein translocase protein TatA